MSARDQQPELPQRITGGALEGMTDAEAEDAIEVRDAKIAAEVKAQGDKSGGVI